MSRSMISLPPVSSASTGSISNEAPKTEELDEMENEDNSHREIQMDGDEVYSLHDDIDEVYTDDDDEFFREYEENLSKTETTPGGGTVFKLQRLGDTSFGIKNAGYTRSYDAFSVGYDPRKKLTKR